MGAGEGLSGRVADAEGRGVAGMRISVTPARKGAWEMELSSGAVSDGAGGFRVPGLADGEYVLATEERETGYALWSPEYGVAAQIALIDSDSHEAVVEFESVPSATICSTVGCPAPRSRP